MTAGSGRNPDHPRTDSGIPYFSSGKRTPLPGTLSYRTADPVYKEKSGKADSAPVRKKESAYENLRNAVRDLEKYTASLSGHSNHELKELADRIRALINPPA